MRSFVIAVSSVLILFPAFFVGAATAADKPCIPGTIQTQSYSFFTVGIAGITSGLKDTAQKMVSRNDKCSDEKVSISKGATTEVTICSTRQCQKSDTTYGCAQGQKPPMLLFGTPSDGYISVNKCHKNTDIINAIFGTIDTQKPDALIALSQQQPQPSPGAAIASKSLDAGTQAVLNVYNGKFDSTNVDQVAKAKAALIAQGMSATDAAAAIEKIGQGDAAGGQAILKRDLSPNTIKQITDLGSGATPRAADIATGDGVNTGGNLWQQTGFGGGRYYNFGGAGGEYSSPFSGGGEFLGGGSPFANVTPAPSGYFNSSPPPQSQQPLTQPSQNTSRSSLAQQILGKLYNAPSQQGSAAAALPIATLIAQPQTVMRGNPIVLSWSSVGMKVDALCTLALGSTVLAQGNEGSKNISTSLGTPTGPTTFTLACTTQAGANMQRSVSVTVQ